VGILFSVTPPPPTGIKKTFKRFPAPDFPRLWAEEGWGGDILCNRRKGGHLF